MASLSTVSCSLSQPPRTCLIGAFLLPLSHASL